MKDRKQYRLKRWYPSLKKTVEVGCIITKIYTCGGYHYRGSDNEGVIFYVSGSQCENNPDFWELIEEEKPKPLFITEDGVEVFEVSTQKMFVVRLSDCEKFIFDTSVWSNISNESKVYYHESNADEYIWRNKRLFSYEDIREYFECEGKFYDIKSIAKERSKE